jgi:hypothetical protein
MAVFKESPELANPLALRLSSSRHERRWEDLGPPLGTVLRLTADTTVFSFLDDSAILGPLRNAGFTCKVDIDKC